MREAVKLAREKGERVIAGLPNVYNLREFATHLHESSMFALEHDIVSFDEVRYGFTKELYEFLRKIERSIISDHITIESKCNCSPPSRLGDSTITLLDGKDHMSWCEQSKELERKYKIILENFP